VIAPAELRPLLAGGRFGAAIHSAASLPSTQQAALEAAAAGASEGTLFLAQAQTQGRGRHGHAWHSPPGAGLYLSLVLRPRLTPQQTLPLTLAFGLAVADAVEESCRLRPEIRWPNDLLLEGRKFCGLLLEANPDFAVLGVGINVAPQPFPPELEPIATALEWHTPAPVSRLQLCAAVVRQLERRYLGFAGREREVLAEFESRSRYARGLEVVVGGSVMGGCALRGVTAGLDESGFLRLRHPDGSFSLVTSGDVRPA
jgi:BirA family biotin operon repressor/biotin-[acetyl-CoA-carboxylase] ligase